MYAADFRFSLRGPQVGPLEKGVAQVEEESRTRNSYVGRPSANAQRDFIQASSSRRAKVRSYCGEDI